MDLPQEVDRAAAAKRVEARTGFYDYAPGPGTPGAVQWHVNFADPHLFVAYGSSLFAQDEMQVAEHPVLGALREALVARGLPALTVEDHVPTPVLVMGAERRCRVATDINPAEGRPFGLYGNAFGRASADAVRRATTRIDPPTITNLVAMAAPPGGYGRYSPGQIENILTTAYTGFRAAVLESLRSVRGTRAVVVHTGFWGCGAFGGDRVLMAMLQVLAAAWAGIDRLVFHTGDYAGAQALMRACKILAQGFPSEVKAGSLIASTAALGFEWGVSDGN